jgi:cyclophilin family peptidyl-prolyl cis-trans isomerase/HEAT repeat protein
LQSNQNQLFYIKDMIKKTICYLFVLTFFIQCLPVKEEKFTTLKIDLKDPQLRQIYNFQDQRKTDSLYIWFRHKNPTYRYAAAMAFASIQDIKALDSLAVLLKDDFDEVKIAAAYAIGQLWDEKAETVLINAFQKDDSLSKSDQFNRAVLESVGKCASPNYLKSLSSIGTYLKTDTLLLEGQALGIYRYALRKITIPEGTQKMIGFLSNSGYPGSVKVIAANYLARGQNLQLDSMAAPLIIGFNQTSDPRVKMALAIALGKTKDPDVLSFLSTKFRENIDYRINCNIIKALGNFDYTATRPLLLEALNDDNIHIATSAAQFLLNHGFGGDAEQYWRIAKDTTLNWQVQMTLYRAANRHLPYYMEATKGRINQELRNRFQKVDNPYEKAAALMALSEFGWNYRFIKDQGFASTNPIVRTAGAEAMAFIANYPRFERFFGLGQRRVKRDISAYFVEAIKSGDPALVGIAAEVIGNPELDYKAVIDSTAFLDKALTNLSLPKEIEAYNELQKAIDYFKGRPKSENKKLDYNHPIDWLVLESLEEETKAIVQTKKGNFELKFLPEKAPGSVANFILLAKNGFFDGKYFHRVVPNFVVQTGGTRGDGWGALDYSIRTEVPMMYYDQEGYVGMASAGKDTEGTQWFITHSPTPHLDGKYTIFAKVIDGMETVHKITIGDKIEKVTITK